MEIPCENRLNIQVLVVKPFLEKLRELERSGEAVDDDVRGKARHALNNLILHNDFSSILIAYLNDGASPEPFLVVVVEHALDLRLVAHVAEHIAQSVGVLHGLAAALTQIRHHRVYRVAQHGDVTLGPALEH